MADVNWKDKAKEEAKDAAEYFEDEIVDEIIGQEGPTKDLYIHDYSDSYVHESIGDDHYSLREAADLLDDLGEFESEDDSLWQGQRPRDAISTMAGETFRSAVQSMFKDIIEAINSDIDGQTDVTLFWDFDEWLEKRSGKRKGVLEWLPDTPLSDEELEEYQELHEQEVRKEVTRIVKENIQEWDG